MNRTLSLIGIVVGLLALGADAHAAQKTSYRVKGSTASYSAYSSTECGYQNLSVYVFEERTGGNQTTYDSVYLDYSAFNYCTGEYSYGYSALDGAAFDINKLQSASVDAAGTIELTTCNYGSGGGGGMGGAGGGAGAAGGGGEEDPCVYSTAPLSVSIDWTGTGDTYKDRYVQVSTTPSARYVYRSSGQTREATVSASILIDGNAIVLSDAYGSLSQSSSASFEIIR
jgi:hypothetical protein